MKDGFSEPESLSSDATWTLLHPEKHPTTASERSKLTVQLQHYTTYNHCKRRNTGLDLVALFCFVFYKSSLKGLVFA